MCVSESYILQQTKQKNNQAKNRIRRPEFFSGYFRPKMFPEIETKSAPGQTSGVSNSYFCVKNHVWLRGGLSFVFRLCSLHRWFSSYSTRLTTSTFRGGMAKPCTIHTYTYIYIYIYIYIFHQTAGRQVV